MIDRYYQTALPDPPDRITAPVYGKTEPPAGKEHRKHLRARDNQIPVTTARNLDDIARAIPHLGREDEIILYRGQTRHRVIQRPAQEHRMLYGAADPGEVSLLTSASREFFPYDEFHGRFQLYLQGLLYEHVPTSALMRAVADETQRLNRPFDDKWIAHAYKKWKAWYGESIWDLVAMGLAQHYGVPTHGLDLTDEPEVALWFAVHQYYVHERRGQKRVWYRRLEGWEKADSPVIYAVAVKADLKRHLDSAMRDLFIPYPLRVGRQSAYLHCGGWGLQANACAEDVRLAIFLEPEFKIPEMPAPRYWFPGPDRDPFYRKMLYAKALDIGELFDRIVDYEDPRDGALYEAIMMERFDEAQTLLESGAGAHYRDPGDPRRGRLDPNRGLTALHWAAFYGRVELVAALLNSGADINATDINGRRPLACAAMRGEAEGVRHLLRRGASADALGYEGWTLIRFRRSVAPGRFSTCCESTGSTARPPDKPQLLVQQDKWVNTLEPSDAIRAAAKRASVSMRCESCGKEGARLRYLTRSYGKGDALLVIENVPVISCPHCGERYMTAETMHELERIRSERKRLAHERAVAVASF